jgi:hypothetical protein
MTIEADLRGILTTSTSVAALSSDRVYHINLIQGVTYPAISYLRISTTRESCMGNDAVNVAARFQFDCWDDDATGANALGTAVRSALQRYGSSTGTVEIETIFIEDQQEIPERDTDENVYRISIDAIVHYKE